MRSLAFLLCCSCTGTQAVPSIGFTHRADYEHLGRNSGALSVGVEFWPALSQPLRPLRVTEPWVPPVLVDEPADGSTTIEGSWGKVELGGAAAAALGAALLGLFAYRKRHGRE